MAKKKPRQTQTRIEGTYDPVPESCEDAAREYVDALYNRMEWQRTEDEARPKLVDAMKAAGVDAFECDGYNVELRHISDDKIKVKKVKAAKADD
jgi:hypothetical protein